MHMTRGEPATPQTSRKIRISAYLMHASSNGYSAPLKEDDPIERLFNVGPKGLSNTELICLMVGGAVDPEAQGHTLELAHRVLHNAWSLGWLSRRSLQELVTTPNLALHQAAAIAAAGEFGRRVHREAFAKVTVNSPEIVCQLMIPEYQGLQQESVQVLLLDAKRQLLRIEEISRGSLRISIAHPREIFRPALLHSADAIVLTHNHPSGDPQPSRQDDDLTAQIKAAGQTLGICLEDHVIIGAKQAGTQPFYSYKQEGKL